MKEDLDEALEALRSALAIQDEVLGNHQETERSHREIAYILKKLGRHEEAKREDLMAQQVSMSVSEPSPSPDYTFSILWNCLYTSTGHNNSLRKMIR